MNQLEVNEQNVMAFYDLMFNRSRPAEAIERDVGDVSSSRTPAEPDAA